MKNQCCKKYQRQRIKCKVELQTVQRHSGKGVEFSDAPKKHDGSDGNSSYSDGDKQEATQEQLKLLRQSVRVSVPPTRYDWEDDRVSFALVTETGDLGSYREVIEADDHDKWITAMEQEMKSLDRNQTWELVDLPKDSKIIYCK